MQKYILHRLVWKNFVHKNFFYLMYVPLDVALFNLMYIPVDVAIIIKLLGRAGEPREEASPVLIEPCK